VLDRVRKFGPFARALLKLVKLLTHAITAKQAVEDEFTLQASLATLGGLVSIHRYYLKGECPRSVPWLGRA
jgi:hypothetical protein